MTTTTAEKVLSIAEKRSILRVKDLKEAGIHPEYLRRLCQTGQLERIGRGLYIRAGSQVSANIALAQAAKWVPHGVVCLLSALRFHDIGTQNPFEVWMALERNTRRPQMDYPRLRILRFSGRAFTAGAQEHQIEGVTAKVYDPAKTVVDCFKYRNKVGIDVAIEALRDSTQSKKCTAAQLWEYARVCRVTKVMEPYLEAVL